MIKPIVLVLLAFATLCPAFAQSPAPRPADALAAYVTTPPVIDGVLDDPAWRQVARAHAGLVSGWTMLDGTLASVQRVGYVCYDRDNLYIAVQCYTPDLYALVAGTANDPWSGDNIEIHINAPSGYFQWGIDIENHVALGRHPAIVPGFVAAAAAGLENRADTGSASSQQIHSATSYASGQWDVEVAIPWKVLGVVALPGTRIGFNLAASHAYQGHGSSPAITWGRSYWVTHNETELELQSEKKN